MYKQSLRPTLFNSFRYFQQNKLIFNTYVAIFAFFLLMTNCADKKEQKQKPILPYKVIQIEQSNTTLFAEYPVTIQGKVDVEIRPKIDGYIEQIYVEEGQEVTKGQLLFKISNPQYAQDLESLTAIVESAKSAVSSAELQVQRIKPLVEDKIVSEYELQVAELNLNARKADLEQAKAKLSNAQTNVGYTTIKSPVNGIVGTIPYRLGSYVNSASGVLTRISDISKVYAYFSMNEKQQLNMSLEDKNLSFSQKIAQLPAVNLLLSTGEKYESQGKIETFSGLANTATGSFNVRAGFQNPKRLLRSGASGTLQIPTDVKNVIIIPQKATMELQDKFLALIVSDSNKVNSVPIEVRPVSGGQFYIVDKGLKANDKLLIEGVGILTEGSAIIPQVVSTDSVLHSTQK